MPDYRAQITPRDRWAIAAYVRALQLSQHAPAAEFPAGRAGETFETGGRRPRPAGTSSNGHTTSLTTVDSAGIDRLQQRGMMVAAAGLVAGAIGVFLQPDQFAPSWLIGFLFCTGLSCGCLALLMLQHMSGGQWGLVDAADLRGRHPAAALLPPALHSRRGVRAEALSLGPARGGQRRRDPQVQGAVPERDVLAHPRGGLLRLLVVLFDAAEQVVGGAGSRRSGRHRSRHAPLPRRQRARARVLHPAHEPGRGRLADVARSALVLDDLRPDPGRRPGAVGAGLRGGGAGAAGAARADEPRAADDALPRPRQADARAGHAVGVLLVLAVPDHLGRQPARRDSRTTWSGCRAAGST